MSLDVRDPWFARTVVDDQVTLLVEPSVHELLRCNIWFVRGRNRDLLIDTGLGVASLRAAVRDLLGRPLLAVATHAHMDHIGGLHEFDDRAIHHAEAESASTASDALPLDVTQYDEASIDWLAGLGYDIRGGLLASIPHERFDPSTHELTATTPTILLSDGDTLDLGDRAFEVLHLPGHSPGSIALWDAESGTLFSGDTVYDGPLLDEIPGADIDAYVASMSRLRDFPVEVVHAGHGPSLSRTRFHEIIDAYIRHRSR